METQPYADENVRLRSESLETRELRMAFGSRFEIGVEPGSLPVVVMATIEKLLRERDEARDAVNRRGMSVSPDSDTVRLMRERDKARTEVEALKVRLGVQDHFGVSETELLRGKIAQLTATLREATKWCHGGHGDFPAKSCGLCGPIIRALESP